MPPKGGRRCVVGGCSNTNFAGYAIYNVKDMPKGTHAKWYAFVEKTRKDFDRNAALTTYICDGHFEEGCFHPSQKMQYFMGTRSQKPSLLKTAVPTVREATKPHFDTSETPSDINPAAAEAISWRNEFVERQWEKAPITYLAPITTTPTTVAAEANTVKGKERRRDGKRTHDGRQLKAKRRLNSQALEKQRMEIHAHLVATTPQHSDTNCKVVNCPELHVIPTQTEPNVRHQQTQSASRLSEPTKKPTRTKKVQFHWRPNHKATQTEMQLPEEVPPKEEPKPKCCCDCHNQRSRPVYKDDDDEEEMADGVDQPEDTRADPDYQPGEEEERMLVEDQLDNDDDDYLDEEEPAEAETKFIVFESSLMELFKVCPECKAPCSISRSQKALGSLIVVHQECTLCDFKRIWHSQPYIGTIPAGNALISAAILFSGASPSKILRVFKHMNIQGISQETFMCHQRLYLQPAVVQTFQDSQSKLIAELKASGQPLILGGDGRCDSPGHCAKFGTYTFMELTIGKIVDIQLVQSNEVENSNQMELEGLKRSFQFLLNQGLTIDTIVTDRHPSITKWLRDTHPEVTHHFDVWHIAKGVKKQLTALSKLKDCGEASLWQKSIVNHLYWSASSTPDGDGPLMAAKFHSITNHMKNKHSGHGEHEEFDQCAHGDLEGERRLWLKEDTKVFDKICEIVNKPHLTRALKQMSPLEQTSNVEAFHGVMCLWAPKLLAYSYTGMKCRSYLAVLHWNENGNRDQASTRDGVLRYKISYPKQLRGGYSVQKVLSGLTFGYVGQLVNKVVQVIESGDKTVRQREPELQPMEPLCSRYERPASIEEAVRLQKARGRFATPRLDIADEGTPV